MKLRLLCTDRSGYDGVDIIEEVSNEFKVAVCG